ncbi:MAG: hypothetical protein AAF497_16525, partial [Planctomycetota bacterium]
MFRNLTFFIAACVSFVSLGWAQDETPSTKKLRAVPGGTEHPRGQLNLEPFDTDEGPTCELGKFVVSENRQKESARNIELQFYRFKARNPSGKAPVFVLPGGPGGYFDGNRAKAIAGQLKNKDSGPYLYLENRDVVLMNQRGARLPDKRYQFFGFLMKPGDSDTPFSPTAYSDALRKQTKDSIKHWEKVGVDVSGYDIMNMVED